MAADHRSVLSQFDELIPFLRCGHAIARASMHSERADVRKMALQHMSAFLQHDFV
eukprot:gene22572-50081_t